MGELRTRYDSSIYSWRDRVVFTSRDFPADFNGRPALVVMVGTQGRLNVTTEAGETTASAVLIGPNVQRSVSGSLGDHISVMLDPIHVLCRYLRDDVLAGRQVVDLSGRLSRATMASLARVVEGTPRCHDVGFATLSLLNELFPASPRLARLDMRVELVASWLWLHVPVRIDLEMLSELCKLSTGRLAHLFSEEIGVSLRQYLLWIKMRKAGEMFLNGTSLTHVAHAVGFSDSAHLSRTFMRYFGRRPSALSNSRRVLVQICDEHT